MQRIVVTIEPKRLACRTNGGMVGMYLYRWADSLVV